MGYTGSVRRSLLLPALAAGSLLLLAAEPLSAAPDPSRAQAVPVAALNDTILGLIDGYMSHPSPPYVWSPRQHTEGVTQPLIWQGVTLAQPDPGALSGVHCSGITFEVYIQALRQEAGEAVLPAEQLQTLKEEWYIREETDSRAGLVEALTSRGLGEPVNFAALQPGDFIQFWRNSGKGHSAIFIRHTRYRTGELRGMVYWSAQGASEGFGYRIVSFGTGEHQLPLDGGLYGVRAMANVAAGQSASIRPAQPEGVHKSLPFSLGEAAPLE